MPHNIFLHSSLVLTRDIDNKNPAKIKEGIKYFSIESSITLFISFLISSSLICTYAHWNEFSEVSILYKFNK